MGVDLNQTLYIGYFRRGYCRALHFPPETTIAPGYETNFANGKESAARKLSPDPVCSPRESCLLTSSRIFLQCKVPSPPRRRPWYPSHPADGTFQKCSALILWVFQYRYRLP